MTNVLEKNPVTHHTCPECGKEYKCYYEENYLEPCPSKEVKYLCSRCMNDADTKKRSFKSTDTISLLRNNTTCGDCKDMWKEIINNSTPDFGEKS